MPNQAACRTTSEKPAGPALPESDDTVAKLPTWGKWTILFVVCWMTLPATFASSSIMTAVAEVATDFDVPAHVITTANAGVFIAMAVSALIWLPISSIIGRRPTYLLATIMLTLSSVSSVTSQSFAFFVTAWIFGGATGLYFLIAGQTILADTFEPTSRGLAVGLFLGSSVAANSLAGVKNQEAKCGSSDNYIIGSLRKFSPLDVFRLFKNPNIIMADFACGLLGFNQYALIASIRRVINPRFNLTTPLISGLFYLAPGAGFLLGSMIGGALSDRTVRQYIQKRNGLRLPQDRLNACLPAFFFLLPLGTLVFGWSLQLEVGGMVLPVISSFVQGFGLMWSFSGLNTYAAEVVPERRTAVISGKYIIQYCFGAGAVGAVVPMIDAIGVGWAFTITGLGATFGGVLVLAMIKKTLHVQSHKTIDDKLDNDADSCV
ncbi:major facilitator superfamily transporter [Colletotrichum kahawae]|uniref:Major facilitator superfamily transporter n=1 Tax=Colletotrichum kahawae TaxID=34407 RepID=A0AAE0D165_COLKA|nr:major facilitator superfamily transporter [Colletotrichum kahawae]